MSLVIAATGHRPKKLTPGRSFARWRSETFWITTRLAEVYLREHTPDKVITGMAQGWDQAVGCAAIRLGIAHVAAIPFIGQETFWPPECIAQYKAILDRSSEVEIISEGDYTARKMQIRNMWMVDRADRMLALYDGSPGGTQNCLVYAGRRQIRVDNLWSIFKDEREPDSLHDLLG